MTGLLLVAAGGALGSVGRYLLVTQAARWLGPDFPWGTFAVNLLGSFAMGILMGAVAHYVVVGPQLRLFFAVGFLGGFTTFSSFSLDAVVLFERGDWLAGIAYVGGSVLAALAAFCAGLAIWRLSA